MFKERIVAALILLAVCTPVAMADGLTPAKVKALDALRTIVTNMGYTTTYSSDKSHFYFQVDAKYDYNIDATVSSNGELVYLYNYIDTFNAQQLAKIQYQKMMEFQNAGNVFFSMDGSSGKGEDLYANEIFGNVGLTPVILRRELDNFTDSLDSTDNLWNQKLWK